MSTTTTAPTFRLPFDEPTELFDPGNPHRHFTAAILAVWNAPGLANNDRAKITDLIRAVSTEAWSKGYREHAETYPRG